MERLNNNSIAVIGSGFSSLAAACYLAQAGYKVEVFEKNASPGGRARLFKEDGYSFDMGPSWYWMPDVFESFFSDFGKKPSDYYELVRLDPSYRVFFKEGRSFDLRADLEKTKALFEAEEEGAGEKLLKFMDSCAENYNLAIKDLVYNPGESLSELITKDTIKRLPLFFKSIKTQIASLFKSVYLRRILEFPVLFLGAAPQNTPAFYNFMNHADLALGTWYPMGGMYEVVKAMVSLAEELGVQFHYDAQVKGIRTEDSVVKGLMVNDDFCAFDNVLSGADYAHTEGLLQEKDRVYSSKYWEKKVFAPSCLLFYCGFKEKLEGVLHHNLFFDEDIDTHLNNVYEDAAWPDAPLFYACFPGKTDPSLSEESKEIAFFLIPLASGLEDNKELHKEYFDILIKRLSERAGRDVSELVDYYRSYCLDDFQSDYHAYKGNAYGLANTLKQTAVLRPSLRSKKIDGLFFSGQLSVPGPGVPPALISGKLSAELLINESKKYEATI